MKTTKLRSTIINSCIINTFAENMASSGDKGFLQISEDILGILYNLTRLNPFRFPAYWGLENQQEFFSYLEPTNWTVFISFTKKVSFSSRILTM